MEFRTIGRSGVRVNPLALGTMVLGPWGNTDVEACRRIVNRALDAGLNLVDTADTYGDGATEEIIGPALKSRRDDVVLATKFQNPVGDHDDPNRQGNSRRWMMRAVEDSLRRLGTDYIDLYQVHRPDPHTDIATIGSLGHLFHNGLRIMGSDPYRPDEMAPLWDTFCDGIGSGEFTAVIDSEFPLIEAAAAQQKMLESDFFGKILLRP